MANEVAIIERQLFALKPMFAQLLAPTNVPAERIIRSVLISCERTPKLLECTPVSVLQAATTGAVLGLEADGHTGQGFLVPFNDRRRGLIAQWLTGYKGYATLAARVGLTVNGGVVREGDAFDFEEGSDGFVHHKKLLNAGRNRPIIGAWATASAPGRNAIVAVLDLDDILAIKDRSKAAGTSGGFSPWDDPIIGFPAMAEKTAKRRLARSLPLSAYIGAARIDEAFEEQGRHAFIHPEKGVVIDGDAQHVDEQDSGGRPDPRGPTISTSRPTFLIKQLDGGELRCNSIEQWRAAMISAAQGISTDENARRFRDLNEAAIESNARSHPDDVASVKAVFAQRLGPASPGAAEPAEASWLILDESAGREPDPTPSRPQSQPASRGGLAEAGGEGLTLAGRTPPPADLDTSQKISQRSDRAADALGRNAAPGSDANDGGGHVTRSASPPAAPVVEIVKPAGGKPDWPGTRALLVKRFLDIDTIDLCNRFRVANSGAINMLPADQREIFNDITGAHERSLRGVEA